MACAGNRGPPLRVTAASHHAKGEVVTGLLYLDPEAGDLHRHLNTVPTALNALSEAELCPGIGALEDINAALR